jgi:signal peptidase I
VSYPRPDYALIKAGFAVLFCAAIIGWVLLVSACAPRAPDPGLVLWEQPIPEVAARAHANEKGFMALRTVGKSMETLIVENDWVVVDPNAPFTSLREGDVILYKPDWSDGFVLHACAARSGEAWIVHGVNNAHYENKVNGGLHVYARHYIGKLVQAYTRRAKP